MSFDIVAGSGTGFDIAVGAVGLTPIAGQSTATISVTGSVSGNSRVAAAAIATVSVTGASSGTTRLIGSVAGSVSVSGNSSGAVRVVGSAVSEVSVTGSATSVLTLIAPTITLNPTDQIGAVGGTSTYTAAANGSEPITGQWQVLRV